MFLLKIYANLLDDESVQNYHLKEDHILLVIDVINQHLKFCSIKLYVVKNDKLSTWNNNSVLLISNE